MRFLPLSAVLAALCTIVALALDLGRWAAPDSTWPIIVADAFLILRADLMTGIAVFAVVQACLLWRCLQGAAITQYRRAPRSIAVTPGGMVVLVGNGLLWSRRTGRHGPGHCRQRPVRGYVDKWSRLAVR